MSIIKDIRAIYNDMPKQQTPTTETVPMNPELLSKTIEHLTKQPVVAPNIAKK